MEGNDRHKLKLSLSKVYIYSSLSGLQLPLRCKTHKSRDALDQSKTRLPTDLVNMHFIHRAHGIMQQTATL